MELLSEIFLNERVNDQYITPEFVAKIKARSRMPLAERRYDVFLSHSYLDRDTIVRIYFILTEVWNLRVFVDWIELPNLDRDNITPITAGLIREAMKVSDTLVYAFSVNSENSRWMPWELGYSDATHGKVAVLPITKRPESGEKFRGSEFLGIYPYITVGRNVLYLFDAFVNDPVDPRKYSSFLSWQKTGRLQQYRGE
jgi:hypothetical protein